MDIKAALEKEHSKKQKTIIVQFIENHPEKLEELMRCFFSDEKMLCQRAAWSFGEIAEKHPHWVAPYFQKIFENLENPRHDAVIRNTLRAWQNMDIPEEYIGQVYELSFNYLNSPSYPIAVRVFAMTVLTNIAGYFPELIPELILTIEEWAPHGSVGFKSRARRELKRLHKIHDGRDK